MNRITERMRHAIALVRTGKTAYAAGREAGITPQALYQSPTYRKIIDTRRASETSRQDIVVNTKLIFR